MRRGGEAGQEITAAQGAMLRTIETDFGVGIKECVARCRVGVLLDARLVAHTACVRVPSCAIPPVCDKARTNAAAMVNGACACLRAVRGRR